VPAKVVTVGELTLDDIVVEGEGADWCQPGGGALYSAIGALVWDVAPAICATVGEDYPEPWLARLGAHGIDTSAVTRIPGASLGLWLLYERAGRRHQIEKASGSSFAHLDAARRPWSSGLDEIAGVHVAPQTPEGQRRELEFWGGAHRIITQDLLIEPYIDADAYRLGEALRGATAFMPSEQEVRQLWGDIDPTALHALIEKRAGVSVLVVKRGAAGVEIVTPMLTASVPTAVRELVDPTGAGDAFSGGFLAGLISTGDVVEAAVRGAVSAALVVETRGALGVLDRLPFTERWQRAASLRAQLTQETR
jgi:sugar/nucleoside kinase (ribokinase family)